MNGDTTCGCEQDAWSHNNDTPTVERTKPTMQMRAIEQAELAYWMSHPFEYHVDEHDDGPNFAAHIANKEALMKKVSGHEGMFGKGAWAFDVRLLGDLQVFETPADRDAVMNAFKSLDGHVKVLVLHYLACTDKKTRLLCFALIQGKGLHMGVMISH